MSSLEDFTDGLDYALVGPRDNRVHIIDTLRFPFNIVCHLGSNFGNGYRFGCTGALVGRNLILTAAHCLYNRRRRKGPLRIAVCPGRRDRDTLPFGCVVAREFYVPRAFTDPKVSTMVRKRHDFGFILLPRPFEQIRRYPPVVALTTPELRRLTSDGLIGIAGYPGDRPTGTMWYHKQRLKRWRPRRLFYTVDTCPGHSGSPIWTAPRGNRGVRIVGVHTSGILDDQGRSYGCAKGTVLAPPNLLNSGVRITPEIASVVRRPNRERMKAIGLIRVGG